MTHPIIKTENYLLVIDDESEIKEGERGLSINNAVYTHYNHLGKDYGKKIIFHLPLNNAPILEGVPLLPPLEDEAEKFAESEYPTTIDSFNDKGWDEAISLRIACEIGYNKAKEKYKFTKEDLFMLAAKVVNDIAKNKGNTDWNMFTTPKMIAEEFIQQAKYPVAFECETVTPYTGAYADDRVRRFYGVSEPKTITNSHGLTQVVGKYIY